MEFLPYFLCQSFPFGSIRRSAKMHTSGERVEHWDTVSGWTVYIKNCRNGYLETGCYSIGMEFSLVPRYAAPLTPKPHPTQGGIISRLIEHNVVWLFIVIILIICWVPLLHFFPPNCTPVHLPKRSFSVSSSTLKSTWGRAQAKMMEKWEAEIVLSVVFPNQCHI